jgi:hypothetical protein
VLERRRPADRCLLIEVELTQRGRC